MRIPSLSVALLLCTSAGIAAELNAALPAAPQPPTTLRLEHCLVSLIDDVEVPAERAGVLRSIAVKEGDYVALDAVLGRIDEQLAKLEWAAANAEAQTARAKADNQLETEYATAEYQVREAEYRISLTANQKEANAVSLVELEKLRLAAEQARIKISVSKYERGLRATEAGGFAAKAEQAEVDIARRRIRAPVAGEIVELFYRPGEWVEPGKPVLRIVRLDRLRIEGFVPFAERNPSELLNATVQVHVAFAAGRRETFVGKVTFVSPLVQPGGEYRIWAEVDNRRDRDQWLLKPGVEAEMEVGGRGQGSGVGGQLGERGQGSEVRGQPEKSSR
ncbi:MAG: HlyD family efflux transporter periplasmic adaptor subunit [Planctomycetia bacterium]|nr:HlyD family efflux transporter periplasmic adaptor subunit [Planctomycetia bacterium]